MGFIRYPEEGPSPKTAVIIGAIALTLLALALLTFVLLIAGASLGFFVFLLVIVGGPFAFIAVMSAISSKNVLAEPDPDEGWKMEKPS